MVSVSFQKVASRNLGTVAVAVAVAGAGAGANIQYNMGCCHRIQLLLAIIHLLQLFFNLLLLVKNLEVLIEQVYANFSPFLRRQGHSCYFHNVKPPNSFSNGKNFEME